MNLLYLNSDQMGSGDPELGRRLLMLFLAKIAESDSTVDHVVCVNGGVKLTATGSEVLNSLHTLAEKGAQIHSCGTCLEHYGRQDNLRVGRKGTMVETVELMAGADHVISPC